MSLATQATNARVLGHEFTISPGVFSPALSTSTEFFARHLVKRCAGRRVLELGCGAGTISILCHLYGAKSVLGTDISKKAVACAKSNMRLHRIDSSTVAFCESAGFSEVTGRFDLIFFALPYVYAKDTRYECRRFGALALSMLDERYETQRSFFRDARGFLDDGGECLIGFSKVGSKRNLSRNLRAFGWDVRLLAREREGRADNQLLSLVDRL